MNINKRINDIDYRLECLPKGTLTYKTIKGKKQPYIQQNKDGKVISHYIKVDEREQTLLEFEEKVMLTAEKKHLQKYLESLTEILGKNPYLDRQAGIGWQSFADVIDKGMLYVDKTEFIKEWWDSTPQISLITRPRRFGKTLMMSMLHYFFDPKYLGCEYRYEKLSIWRNEKYRNLYGTIPTILVSFASVKSQTFEGAIKNIRDEIRIVYDSYAFLEESKKLDINARNLFTTIRKSLYEDTDFELERSIRFLMECLYKHFGVKPIILLDEYDTPIIEAYTSGYYDRMIEFYRCFFNITFKNNDFLYRAIITGINKVSKNSLYSDMNNIYVYSMLTEGFDDYFGFTEDEVKDILKCQDIDLMRLIKANYDGFIIGNSRDIYNPWSICNFIYTGKIDSYWVNTSSNKLIGELIKEYPTRNKVDIELLIQGKELIKPVNEELAVEYIKGDEASFWALMVSVGYVKAEIQEQNVSAISLARKYRLTATNVETLRMLEQQALYAFPANTDYNVEFAEALINGRIDRVNEVLEDILLSEVSFFDTGNSGGGRSRAENFYHGLVLGLIVVLKNRYHITSNRESGKGRYDICMIPITDDKKAFVIEFKVRNHNEEGSLQDTVNKAFTQIEEKEYERDILSRGIKPENIRKMAFAFDGKDVLVEMVPWN